MRVSLDFKLDTSGLGTMNTSVSNWDNPGFVLSDFEEHWLGEIEVFLWWVAPAVFLIAGIGWTEVCSCDLDASGQTPLWTIRTLDLVTCPTSVAIVE